MNPDTLFNDVEQTKLIQEIKSEYYYLLEHIDALRNHIYTDCEVNADVFWMPTYIDEDVGKKTITLDARHIQGSEAVARAMDHFSEYRLTQSKQSGVMARRLPGVLHVKSTNQDDIISRVKAINLIKDKITSLIRDHSKSKDDQFELTKNAIPLAIRKAIGRHIPIFEESSLKRIGFSFSSKSSFSKTEPRDFWLKKLYKTRMNVRNKINVQEWMIQLDIEEQSLNHLPSNAMLRIKRPIRKSPIANVLLLTGHKTTLMAHSPIISVNNNVTIKPFSTYTGNVTGPNKRTEQPIVPRWHLYLVNDINVNTSLFTTSFI